MAKKKIHKQFGAVITPLFDSHDILTDLYTGNQIKIIDVNAGRYEYVHLGDKYDPYSHRMTIYELEERYFKMVAYNKIWAELNV